MRLSLLSRVLFFCMGASFVAPAPVAASSPGLIGLERELSMLIAGRPGEYGIAALDLRDGSTVAVNGDIPFPMASTVKLAIAGAYLAEVEQGRRSLADTIVGRSAARLIELLPVPWTPR